jgi:hypothetical protein
MEPNLDYREQADKCTRIAHQITDPELRTLLLSMAQLWLSVAEKSGAISAPASTDRESGAVKANKGPA